MPSHICQYAKPSVCQVVRCLCEHDSLITRPDETTGARTARHPNMEEMLLNIVYQPIDLLNVMYMFLCRWLLSVRKNYRPVAYHNWRHAFNVAQMMFAILRVSKLGQLLGELETLSLLLACLSHDLDHRGINNSFLKGNQILSHLSAEEYRNVIHVLKKAILATDLTVYFKAMLMTACDIAAITKPWKIQRKIAVLIANEFFEQGDAEKQLKLEPTDMMNRDKKDKLPLMQVAFIDSICLPLYEAFALISDKLGPLLEGVKENRAQWLKLAEEKRTSF
ncbi:dual 3',5'-cyclic-AMP and -GMP phosphodiesterase 11 [Caerostris extrusa]|uniref:Dual 3',5'-cyclic-AMP and -GMP phosphodiesterase 11 n=1 Tax=Caerostris extrusa TaxID=172846 RepID=A0AAV4SE33_CAEEX|nr:dual 3',5'-cyclic-AMP and -GMP phosphodiesterase 11 [Caerostris extrusa]